MSYVSEPTFGGHALDALRIDTVIWKDEAVEHMEKRRREQGVRVVSAEEATEAALDPSRIVRVAGGGRSLKVVGRCASTGRTIKVWLWPEDMDRGAWLGGSAVDANPSDQRRYDEVLERGEQQ